MKRGAVLIGLLQPLQNPADVEAYAGAGIAAFAMELMPRITRAQTMDVLSSQANLAGYKAVLDAAAEFGRAFPMMMTAAGTIKAARVLVMGAGVAGLQAIATARRLGAIVSATDVRAAAKEQVESLGATFITVDEAAARSAETAGGYAREMGEDYQRRQREQDRRGAEATDIVICTALIPGRQAPVLLTERDGRRAAPRARSSSTSRSRRRQCRGQPARRDRDDRRTGSRSSATLNMPSRIAVDASQLYARNLLAFLALLVDNEKQLKIDTADEIVKATLLTSTARSSTRPSPTPAASPARRAGPGSDRLTENAWPNPHRSRNAPASSPAMPARSPQPRCARAQLATATPSDVAGDAVRLRADDFRARRLRRLLRRVAGDARRCTRR